MPDSVQIAVIGIGNILMGDDALGPYVIHRLGAQFHFPAAVDLLDLGTAGADLAIHLADREAVVVIDTVAARGQPGEIRQYDKAQLLSDPVFVISQHQPGLKEALLTMQLTGGLPREVRLIGVIPEIVETRLGLSPKVETAVDGVIELVLEELSCRGHVPKHKTGLEPPSAFWDQIP